MAVALLVGLCSGYTCVPLPPEDEEIEHRVLDYRSPDPNAEQTDNADDPQSNSGSGNVGSLPGAAQADSGDGDDESAGESALADAGRNRVVPPGANVELNASNSRYADSPGTWFLWTQVSGPTVKISKARDMRAKFVAPTPSGTSATLRFEVAVGRTFGGIGRDTVDITVARNVPKLTLGAATIDFGEEGVKKSLSLQSESSEPFTVQPTADWLQVTPGKGTVGPTQAVTLSLALNRTLLSPGEHATTVEVLTDSGRAATATVSATNPIKEDDEEKDDENTLAPGVLANQSVGERWLFSHPGPMRGWILPNMEKYPDEPRLITGIFCVFVESPSQADSVMWLNDVRSRCQSLGLDFVFGVRHSWSSEADMVKAFSADWQRATMNVLIASGEPNIMIESEAYYDEGLRYPTQSYLPLLQPATAVWSELGPKRFFVYPIGKTGSYHTRTIMHHAVAGGSTVFALASSTYDALKYADLDAHMADMAQSFAAESVIYTPGFRLRYARHEKVMKAAAKHGRCWFFGLGTLDGPDDTRDFGAPFWNPQP